MTVWKGKQGPIGAADFKRAAFALDVSEPVIRAIFEVESSGKYYRSDGSVERRFEPHHFPKKHWPALGFSPAADQAPWRASLAVPSNIREAMFAKAVAIHLEAALRATSWGAPQIMGFNHISAGYPSAQAMVSDMADRAAAHLEAFTAFVKSKGLSAKLRAHDWRGFAVVYNGNGQADAYAKKIEAAYRKHSGKPSAVVIRLGSQGEAVKELQRALGLDPDGGFGPKTEAAVKAYQARSGLTPDGVVGDKTWDSLRRIIPELSPPAQATNADLAGKVAGYSAAATAASGAIAAIGDALPEAAMNYLVAGASVAGVMAAAAWLFVKVRARV